MKTATAKKRYDPYQPVDLTANTSSMESRRAATLGTSKIFSGAIWFSKEHFPPSHLILKESERNGKTAANLQPNRPSSFLANDLHKEGYSLDSIYNEPVLVPKHCYVEVPRFVSLQKWECIVLDILDDAFTARLIDLTNKETDEEAEFSIEEIPEADLFLLKPGAVFYWNIGYEDSLSGQRTRSSTLRFRRLPVWRSEELAAAKQEAKKLGDALNWK